MRIHTVHVLAGAEPVLVREGFSWTALLLPTVWFLWHRLWLVTLLHLVAVAAVALLLPGAASGWVLAAGAVLVGMHARDLWRWTLARRGYAMAGVVAAKTEDEALLRLAAERPDLVGAARGTFIAGPGASIPGAAT